MKEQTRNSINLRRRRLLTSSAVLLAAGAALGQSPVAAQEIRPPAMPPVVDPNKENLPPFVRPRADWGALPPARAYVPHTPKRVTLHHTGAPWSGRPQIEQYLRNLQAFHTGPEREWEDIAYHFLIDLEGVVWAGRPPEVRGNPSVYYDSLGLVLICFVGDYGQQELSAAQVAAASKTAAWILRRYNLAPEALSGHRDHAPTACPGDAVYRLLQNGSFASKVRSLLA